MNRQFFLLAQVVITSLLFFSVEAYLIAFFAVLILTLDLKDNRSWIVMLLFSTSLEAFSLFGFKVYDLIVLIVLFFNLKKGLHSKVYFQFIGFLIVLTLYMVVSIRKGIGFSELYADYLRYFFCFFWLIAGYDLKKNGVSQKQFDILMLIPWVMVIQGGFYLISNNLNLGFATHSFLVTSELSGSREGEVRVAGLFTDPNKYYITWFYLLAIFLVLFKGRLSNKSLSVLLAFTVLVAFVSLSRTAILVAALFVVITIFLDLYYRIQFRETFVLLPLILVSLIAFFVIDWNQLFFEMTYSLRGERVSQFSGSLESEKRFLNWILILNDMTFSNILIGNGLATKDFWSNNFMQPPHNTLLGVAYQFGVIFTLYFLGFFWVLIKKYKRLIIPVLFLTIAPMLVIDLFGFRLLWFLFAVLYLTNENEDNSIYQKFWA